MIATINFFCRPPDDGGEALINELQRYADDGQRFTQIMSDTVARAAAIETLGDCERAIRSCATRPGSLHSIGLGQLMPASVVEVVAQHLAANEALREALTLSLDETDVKRFMSCLARLMAAARTTPS
jgi:hypothetical protein